MVIGLRPAFQGLLWPDKLVPFDVTRHLVRLKFSYHVFATACEGKSTIVFLIFK